MDYIPFSGSDYSLSEWLDYLEKFNKKQINLGLQRVQAILNKLNLNQHSIKFIVGGTNGKGSTCAMLEAIFLSAGYKVGLYTSPHFIKFNERARINGEFATDVDLIEQFLAINALCKKHFLTYFEFTTLSILRLFAQLKLDIIILEVGLGGRLDAVNAINPDCSIITNIGIDHTKWLGSSREEIGLEKSYISRSGKPIICGDSNPPQSLLNNIRSINANLWLFEKNFNFSYNRQQWNYIGYEQKRNALPYPTLRGKHQLLNATIALAAIESTKSLISIPQHSVRQGLIRASIPGRFQILPTNNSSPTVVLDVAHNPHAAEILAKNLDTMGYYPCTYAIFGMLNDKDVIGVIQKLGIYIDHWYCVNLPDPRGISANILSNKVRQYLLNVNLFKNRTVQEVSFDPKETLSLLQKNAFANDRIVIFGSFHTVAPILPTII
ncbi:MAG: bifunctional tetrahydrofolate synthase/dihydrofolate synthase [Bordetella sp.]|nr:MAG: bifunctional tetrahydrofolate synthase/dihydrofolate synthase [Bordetella sp.]